MSKKDSKHDDGTEHKSHAPKDVQDPAVKLPSHEPGRATMIREGTTDPIGVTREALKDENKKREQFDPDAPSPGFATLATGDSIPGPRPGDELPGTPERPERCARCQTQAHDVKFKGGKWVQEHVKVMFSADIILNGKTYKAGHEHIMARDAIGAFARYIVTVEDGPDEVRS